MNIFYLDPDPIQCAQYHTNTHVTKMILETAQILSTAHQCSHSGAHERSQVRLAEGLYRPTHINHPSSLWARESQSNYRWLYALFRELHAEWKWRFRNTLPHESFRKLSGTLSDLPDFLAKNDGNDLNILTAIPQCMPDEYKVANNPVLAYRRYIKYGKTHLHKWGRREIPTWMDDPNT